ncbi:MAG: glycosyltransferase family 2 protein, partial [Cyclobacteriaceae bacterium]|nr:glycosyltransferase family 2 protein [Cyclobacteriaceae bacterium]
LEKCIESILNQTFHNFELFLLNDGSADNSGALCDKFAQSDSRIKVFHKKNEGASDTRNKGIESANGKYLTFIDSDDWIDEQYLQNFLCPSLEDNEHTFVIQGVRKEFKDSAYQKFEFPNLLLKKEQLSILFSDYNILESGFVCAKLYNRELINQNNIRFQKDIKVHEDLLFMLEYLSIIKLIQALNNCNYHYIFDNPDSLTKQQKPFKGRYTLFIQLKEIRNKLTPVLNERATYQINKFLGEVIIDAIINLYSVVNNKGERLNFIKTNFTIEDLQLIKCSVDTNIFKTLLYRSLLRENYNLFDFSFSMALKVHNNILD